MDTPLDPMRGRNLDTPAAVTAICRIRRVACNGKPRSPALLPTALSTKVGAPGTSRHEVPALRVVEPEAAEGPDPAHVAVDLRGLRALRPADGHPDRVLVRGGGRGSGPPHDVPQGLLQPAAAPRAPGRDRGHPGSGGGDACDLVRRRLPGPEEPVRAARRGRRELPGHAPRPRPPVGPASGLAGGPHGM